MCKLDKTLLWLKYKYIKIILIIIYALAMYVWVKYGIYKTDFNTMQLTLTSIVQLLTTLIGIILAIIIFISPQIIEAKSKLKYSRKQISNYFSYGEKEPNNSNKEFPIEAVRLQILEWINTAKDADVKQDLTNLLEITSSLCINIINDTEYHKKVNIELLSNKNNKTKDDEFMNEMVFFGTIEKLHVAYWFRHIDIPFIPLYQNFYENYLSSDFFHNNLIATFGMYMTGKKINLIFIMSSFLIIVSLITLSITTQDNFINGFHILNVSCGSLLFLTVFDIGLIANYIYEVKKFIGDFNF